MSNEIPVQPKNNNSDLPLTEDEKRAILRALGYYQVHLFDEMMKNKEDTGSLKADSLLATSAIKKIHKTIEK